jgi:antitoxin VapB
MYEGCQAVQLPEEFRFSFSEVFIRQDGDEVILSPRSKTEHGKTWKEYLERGAVASEGFMDGVEDLPMREDPEEATTT